MASPGQTTPYWAEAALPSPLTPLDRDGRVDVVVVGAGVTGLTAAYLLAQAGRSVAVLERRRCVTGDTGHTTAHLTMVTDTRLVELDRRLGGSHAQAVWDAGLAAIAQIESAVEQSQISCGFTRVDGFLHAPTGRGTEDEVASLREEAALASELGFAAEYMDRVPLMNVAGIRFAHQARVHPRQYLAGLVRATLALGGRIHEESEATEFHPEPRGVSANGHTLTCDHIVIATHNPLVGLASTVSASLFQTKLALYTSYVVAGRVPRGSVPDALWWDTADPYRYLRVVSGDADDLIVFGGEDHKTGQTADTTRCYEALEAQLRAIVPQVRVTHRWSGQVIETPDGLPFIGSSAEHQFSATGYAGNGITFGTLAAMIMTDAIVGRRNPWAELFAPDRPAIRRGVWDYLKENADYPYYMIRDRLAGAGQRSLAQVQPEQGCVVEHHGAKVAAYRDAAGTLTLRSAVCTHQGCIVAWNTAERTWDCPCHGSRFTPDGEVIAGPAESPLAAVTE